MTEAAKWVFVLSVTVALLIGLAWIYGYVQKVLPTLYRHGEPSVWASRKSDLSRQLESYGRLCREYGESLAWHRYLVVSTRVSPWLAVVATLAWLVLLAKNMHQG
jgi:hypothetical protein